MCQKSKNNIGHNIHQGTSKHVKVHFCWDNLGSRTLCSSGKWTAILKNKTKTFCFQFFMCHVTPGGPWKSFLIFFHSIWPKILKIIKVWVAKVRAHTHTCDVRSHVCVCVRNPFCKVCGMCVRASRFLVCDVRPYFCTLLEQNCQKMLFYNVLSRFRTSFPALERPFLF